MLASEKQRYAADDLIQLMNAPDYRVFISSVITCRRSSGRKFGYSDIARNGGFAARSFPRDVTLGKKNISSESLNKLILGLGLKGDLASYFRLLVEREHPNCKLRASSIDKIAKNISNLKNRILSKNSVALESARECAFANEHFPIIYAALGTIAKGASLVEISRRTKLSVLSLKADLEKMVQSGLIEKRKERYFAKENHIDLSHLDRSLIFKSYFLGASERAYRNASKHFSRSSSLHLSSSFSIKAKDFNNLRSDLRSVLLSYIDNSEVADGDQVLTLVCSLF